MKRAIGSITGAFLLIGLYFIIRNFLFWIDDIPRWCEIEHPEYIIIDKTFSIKVKYQNIILPSQLNAALIFFDKSEKYSGEKINKNPVQLIDGEGECTFSFIITDEDLKEKDISKVTARININNLPVTDNNIYSEKIPLVSLNKDGTFSDSIGITFFQVIKKAIFEGYWIQYAGDYTVEGWFITLSYFFVCILCYLYLIKIRKKKDKVDSYYIRFWFILIIILFILGINKQLDIQMLLTDIGRIYSMEHGWYDNRKIFQIEFTSFLAIIGIGFLFVIIYFLINIWRQVSLALFGLSILFSFVIVKSVSIHLLEHFFSTTILGITFFGIIELIGLICIGSAVIFNYRNIKYNIEKT